MDDCVTGIAAEFMHKIMPILFKWIDLVIYSTLQNKDDSEFRNKLSEFWVDKIIEHLALHN